jgi:hypothetical protein
MITTGDIVACGTTSTTVSGSSGGASTLEALYDTTISNPVKKQVLIYDGSHWKNESASEIQPSLTGYATETWVNNQSFVKTAVLSSYATTKWVTDNFSTDDCLPLTGGTLTGTLTSRAIAPSANNTYALGSSSYEWSNVYATTFTGALSGNATSASCVLSSPLTGTYSTDAAAGFIVSGGDSSLSDYNLNSGMNTVLTVGLNISRCFQLQAQKGSNILRFRSGNANQNAWESWTTVLHSGNYNSYALPLSGGTMSGTLTLNGSQYKDEPDTGALNANNSNIYNVNQIQFGDLCETANEGIQFYNTTTTVDSLWANSGVLYFTPNRTWGNTTATNRTVLHSGNYSSYALPLSGGTLSGALRFANGTWNLVGDDVYMGDCNVAGGFGLKGNNDQTSIVFYNYKNNTSAYTKLLSQNVMSTITLNLPSSAGTLARTDDTVAAAKKLSTTCSLWGNDFNGTQNLTGSISVTGSVTATGEITAGSDMRYKQVVSDLSLVDYSSISNAPIFKFVWSDGREDTAMHLGSSAQYWQEVFPELVQDGDMLSLNYSVLGTIIGVFNSRRIDALEERVKQLEDNNYGLQ